MARDDHAQRLAAAAMAARSAEDHGDDAAAVREWRRFRLIEDAGRDADDLLDEGIALSVAAMSLIEPAS